MCTLTIKFDPVAEYPLIVAANRDELLNRPSVPPDIISTHPAIFAPKDLKAGGTWFGINEFGLLATTTNVWLPTDDGITQGEKSTRSRGLLTLDSLRCGSVAEAVNAIRTQVLTETFQYFNLLIASTTEAVVMTFTGELKEFPLKTGVASILNSPYKPETGTFFELPTLSKDEISSRPALLLWLEQIRTSISSHPKICKHKDIFGTRCAQVAVLGRRDQETNKQLFQDFFWFADGAPCQTEFQNLSITLQEVTEHVSFIPEEV
ncbi:MAG TPA: NRDE family protein [Nitrospinaceae bacterium]|jgi:hypothetical protein|nr:NRDE family protein [Nitrospinaceae bacterium]|tara:strand:- start:1592 stop:2380 length:789 start_codon:yes stop_codon:yes gene_type:complete